MNAEAEGSPEAAPEEEEVEDTRKFITLNNL